MWKFLNNFKTKVALVVGCIILLSQIPTTRDTAFNIAGIALASEQKQTIKVLQQQADFNKFIMEMLLSDSLLKQGMDSAAVDTFIKYLEQQWDSLLNQKKMKGGK